MTVRPLHSADLDGVLRVLAEALPRDPISWTRFTRQVLLDPNFLPEGALVALEGSEVSGFCLALARQVPLENAPPDPERGYVTLLGVRPGFRRRGTGTRLLEAAESFLRAQGRSLALVAPYAPGYFIPGVDVHAYADGLGFFLARGYSEVYRPLAMETPLWDCKPPDWVLERAKVLSSAGISIERFRPELTLPLLDFTRREFPGDWVRVVREAAGQILTGESTGRLIAAWDGERILGFVHHHAERFGPIGVAPSERGRGLGQVLMFEALAAMREQGYRTAWFLWSDDRTAARLYTGAGFREVRRFALLRKELVTPGA